MWPVLSMLKDATGLDRVRTGDLERSYLRSDAAKGMVEFAQALYSQTRRIKEGPNHFTEVLKVAEKILGKPVPIPALVLGPLVTKAGKGKGRQGCRPGGPGRKGRQGPNARSSGEGQGRSIAGSSRQGQVRAGSGQRTPNRRPHASQDRRGGVDKTKARRRSTATR
jgi:hypothetical protein